MSVPVEIVLTTVLALGLLAAPVMLVWGWIRWARREKKFDFLSACSFGALTLATTSAGLAISAWIYSAATGGFAYYDPPLLRFIRYGFYIAAIGFLFGFAGAWRNNPLRWHGLVAPLGMAAYWVSIGVSE